MEELSQDKELDKGIYDNQIEIEIIPNTSKEDKNYFIYIKKENESYYHIYFNGKKKEIKRNYYTKNDNIKKINIIMDKEIKSFKDLFFDCMCIEKINFIKFNRNDINNMNSMFSNCKYLKELNLNNFNTDNVTDMNYMFNNCKYLKELNLNNFNLIM